MDISGNGSFNFKGAFYAEGAEVKISGNGDVSISSLYLSRLLSVRGNGDIHIGWDGNPSAWGCLE